MYRLLVFLLIMAEALLGQETVAHTARADVPPASLSNTLAEEALRSSADFPAPTRSFICADVADVYARTSPQENRVVLPDCFRATLQIQDVEIRRAVQSKIIAQLVALRTKESDLVYQTADPEVQDWVRETRLRESVSHRKWDEAIAILQEVPSDRPFPYQVATDLMLNLPSSRVEDIPLIFSLALRAYKQAPVPGTPQLEDVGTMVVRFWQKLPRPLVLDAIDEELKRAKQTDEKIPFQIVLGTDKGQAAFRNTYVFRLFELLPVLRELDPVQAKTIEEDSPELQPVLAAYPQGLPSLAVDYSPTRDAGSGGHGALTITYNAPGAPTGASAEELQLAELRSRVVNVEKMTDFHSAMEKAQQLPLTAPGVMRSPEIDAIMGIALAFSKEDRADSTKALAASERDIDRLPPAVRAHYHATLANLYIRLGDAKSATRCIDEGLEDSLELYKVDTNSDDPNTAFKFYWPSAVAWRTFILLQAHIAPEVAVARSRKIPDEEIRTDALVAIAADQAKVPFLGGIVQEKFKARNSTYGFPLTM